MRRRLTRAAADPDMLGGEELPDEEKCDRPGPSAGSTSPKSIKCTGLSDVIFLLSLTSGTELGVIDLCGVEAIGGGEDLSIIVEVRPGEDLRAASVAPSGSVSMSEMSLDMCSWRMSLCKSRFLPP